MKIRVLINFSYFAERPQVDSPYEQFWYSELVPFVHYIPVDAEHIEDDLPGKLRWALEHDAEYAQHFFFWPRKCSERHFKVSACISHG